MTNPTGFTPLFLTCDDKTAANLMEDVLRNKSAATKLYAELFVTFMNGSNTDLIKQIHAARKYSLNGLVIFDYAHFGEYYRDVLKESVFRPIRNTAVSLENNTERIVNDISTPNEVKKEKKKRGRRR